MKKKEKGKEKETKNEKGKEKKKKMEETSYIGKGMSRQ